MLVKKKAAEKAGSKKQDNRQHEENDAQEIPPKDEKEFIYWTVN